MLLSLLWKFLLLLFLFILNLRDTIFILHHSDSSFSKEKHNLLVISTSFSSLLPIKDFNIKGNLVIYYKCKAIILVLIVFIHFVYQICWLSKLLI